MRILRGLWARGPWLLFCGALLAIAIRLTVRDRLPILSTIFYATPPILVSLACLLAASVWLSRRRWRPGAASLTAGLACALWWHGAAYFHNAPAPAAPAPAAGSLRLLFWNASHGNGHWPAFAEAIRGLDPDVVGMVEGDATGFAASPFWARELPAWRFRDAGGGIVLLSKLAFRPAGAERLGRRSRCKTYRIEVAGGPVTLLLVDLNSNPLASRRGPLEGLDAAIRPLLAAPLVAMGDFNTPSDSAFLDPMRERLSNAFETRGNGLAATWPVCFPVLTLDQVWTDARVSVRRCEHGWSTLSDHRWVLTDISIR